MEASAGAEAPSGEETWPAWPAGPAEPALPAGSLHVWLADLAAPSGTDGELLSAEERERAAKILDEGRRALWQRSREVLRALLGRYLALAPRAVELSSGAHGKPKLAGVPRPAPGVAGGASGPPAFNLSHSGHLALYAFAAEGAVGVDLELARPTRRRDHLALARRALGDEAAAGIERLPPRLREGEFLRLWTRHEAVLKWRGTGFGEEAGDGGLGGAPWLTDLELGARAAGAVACSRAPRELRLWSWP